MIELARKTKETDVTVKIGADVTEIDTGIGFFDHMLTAFAVHSGIPLYIYCDGDIDVDCHHTAEDVGIVLGAAFKEYKAQIGNTARYGDSCIPMDEALGFAAADFGNRAFLVFNCEFRADKIGELDTQCVEEFFRAFAFNAGITLHLSCPYGENDHHKAEAMFKAFAHAVHDALVPANDLLSTKGAL